MIIVAKSGRGIGLVVLRISNSDSETGKCRALGAGDTLNRWRAKLLGWNRILMSKHMKRYKANVLAEPSVFEVFSVQLSLGFILFVFVFVICNLPPFLCNAIKHVN